MCYTFIITHAQYLFYFYESVITIKTNETYANRTKTCPCNYRLARTRILNNASLEKVLSRERERKEKYEYKREREREKKCL